MTTLYKPEKVFGEKLPTPKEVEAFFDRWRQIRDTHGGLTPLELERGVEHVRKAYGNGETRLARSRLWKYTIAVCAWALANQHRVRRKKAVEWVPLGDLENHTDLSSTRGVYNLLRGCMVQTALIWEESNEVACHINDRMPLTKRGRGRLTLRVENQKAVLRCAGFKAKTDLCNTWGTLAAGSFSSLVAPTPANLQPKPAVEPDLAVIRPALLLRDSVAGTKGDWARKKMRIATMDEIEVPYRWDPFAGPEAPLVRRASVARVCRTEREFRAARRGYGRRLYRSSSTARVSMGTTLIVL